MRFLTLLYGGCLTPVSGSWFHLGHLYFGVESGDSRQGRLVRSAKNQFIRGVEVDLVGGFLANVRILY